MKQWRSSPNRHGHISQFLHWLMAFLIFCMLGIGWLLPSIPGSWKSFTIDLHKSVGITILMLLALRIGWRISQSNPALPDGLHGLQVLASKATHALLYALMFFMPLSGWAMSSASGKSLVLFDLFAIPALVEKDRALAITLKTLHGAIAYVLILVIALHVAAAFYHHFIRKDDTLKRMLPTRCMK